MTEPRLEHLSPATKLVYKTLQYEGKLTQQEITNHSMLSSRTVRAALTTLIDQELVSTEIYIPDARQRLYTLTDVPSLTASA